MLETPLFGRFQGENKRLVFSAPLLYHGLVRGCIGTGIAMVLYGLFAKATGFDGPIYADWWVGIGILVTAAGIAAAFSLTSITFDLRERIYKRRQGPGLFPRQTIGPLTHLDAIVIISEPNSRLTPGGVTYHLVLHWKARPDTGGSPGEPLMVLQTDTRQIIAGQPLNIGAQQLIQVGAQYAQAIGVPFYDNSHFASKCPVPIW